MVFPTQPTLPAEIPLTDPELNFIDESPHGFFPENQDSNWGYRRKVFSDRIQEIFGQLDFIYTEMFPTTAQELLDEWEETTGLPQNPANKSVGERRQRVLARLRGGPFTRKMRREIVESYITATFGEPILLLPPGHPLAIAGSPLYNEVGDVTQLYMILETVEQFKYEVRIKTGMALDTVGLERDLRYYTPAGLQVIMNYAWEGKFVSDSGSIVDIIDADTGFARLMTVYDLATGREAIGRYDTETATGTDFGRLEFRGTDSGAGTEGVASFDAEYSQFEGATGIESIGDFKSTRVDTGHGTDNAIPRVNIPPPIEIELPENPPG